MTNHLSSVTRSIHIHCHASAGSDECGHERDERLVRKYNKEVTVFIVEEKKRTPGETVSCSHRELASLARRVSGSGHKVTVDPPGSACVFDSGTAARSLLAS